MTEEPNTCPLCGQAGGFKLETDEVWGNTTGVDRAFFHCRACDVFFQWPRLTPEEEARFYKDEFEKFMEQRTGGKGIDWSGPEQHIRTNQEQRLRRETYLQPHYERAKEQGAGTLLEVGCSSGFMLLPAAKDHGLNVVGIEPSGAFSAFLHEQGVEAYLSLEALKEARPEGKYDIITHFFVLEHIQEPKSFVQDLYDMLAPGGTLIMEVPNAADPLRTVYPTEAFKRFYWSVAHPWYFTEGSLRYLLEVKCGLNAFNIMGDQRYDIGNHTQWLRDGRPGGQGSLSETFDSEFDAMFKEKLIGRGRCDTLVAFVSKGDGK